MVSPPVYATVECRDNLVVVATGEAVEQDPVRAALVDLEGGAVVVVRRAQRHKPFAALLDALKTREHVLEVVGVEAH